MTKTEDPVLIVSVHVDRLDAAVAIEFKRTMQNETLDGPKIVVFDWSAVYFIDSSGLGAIVPSMIPVMVSIMIAMVRSMRA